MKFNLFTTSIVASVAVVTTASADTTQLTYQGTFGNVINIISPGYSGGANVGQELFNLSGSTGAYAGLDGNWIGYCCDYYQFTGSGEYNFTTIDTLPTSAPMGAAAAQGVTNLYAFAAGSQYGIDVDLACAFQLAIWEVIGDTGSLDINSGNFQASGMNGATSAYLSIFLAAAGTNGSASLVGLANEGLQDFIIETPAPGAIALVGIAGLVGARRRRA